MAEVAVSFPNDLQRRMSMRDPQFGQDTKNGHQGHLKGESCAEPHRRRKTVLVAYHGGKDGFVDPHPWGKDRWTCEAGAHGSIGHHKHFGSPRVFHQVQFLYFHCNENDGSKQNTKADNESISGALAYQTDSVTNVYHPDRPFQWIVWNGRLVEQRLLESLVFDRLILSLEEVPGVLRHWEPDNVLVKSSFRHPAGLHEEQHFSPRNILARGLEIKRRRLLQTRVVYLHERPIGRPLRVGSPVIDMRINIYGWSTHIYYPRLDF